jgi:hypothetical protein
MKIQNEYKAVHQNIQVYLNKEKHFPAIYEMVTKFWFLPLQNYQNPEGPRASLHITFTNHVKFN